MADDHFNPQAPYRILAEVLRLQRWAAGESIDAATIFGLEHGVESVIDRLFECRDWLDRDTQERAEDIIEAVEAGSQSTDGMSIKNRLQTDQIDESDFSSVLKLLLLEGRFTDGVTAIIEGRGSVFAGIKQSRPSEQQWRGNLHYIELVDCSSGEKMKLHAVYASAVPCVGDTVTPEGGQQMRVIEVEHMIATVDHNIGFPQKIMTPHVYLVADDDGDEETTVPICDDAGEFSRQ